MLAKKPIIVFFMLFVPSLCDQPHPLPPPFTPRPPPPEPDWGSSEEFLKEVNEFRAKFAKEHKIPNMCKLVWSNELVKEINNGLNGISEGRLIEGYREFWIDSYQNPAESISAETGKFGNLSEIHMNRILLKPHVELINALQTFIGCVPQLSYNTWDLKCYIGFDRRFDILHADPEEAGSQCPPRFKGENGLCVPVDPSKYTFWGTEDQLLEDVNYMRRKYAKKYGIPNMHQLKWNESLIEVLKSLDLNITYFDLRTYGASNDSSWDGFGNNWRFTELMSFSTSVPTIDEDVHSNFFLDEETDYRMIRGKKDSIAADEMIHPLQTSIGCMKKKRREYLSNFVLTACLLGNMGQWPSNWKLDVNSTIIPGSECMDGYVNDDGLCSIPLPTTTSKPVQNIPKKPEVTGAPVKEAAAMESEQEEAESSSTIRFSYGLWIIYLFLSFF